MFDKYIYSIHCECNILCYPLKSNKHIFLPCIVNSNFPSQEDSEEDEEGDVEGDSLEAETADRKKRDIDMSEFFNFVSKAQPQESEEDDDSPSPQPGDNTDEDVNYVYGDDYAQEEDYSDVYDDGSDATAVDDQEAEEEEDKEPSYDSNTDLPDFDSQGKYTLELVGQRKLLSRERRGVVNHLELPEATQSSLMAQIDHSQFTHTHTLCSFYCLYIPSIINTVVIQLTCKLSIQLK